MIYLPSQLNQIVSVGGGVVIDMNKQLFIYSSILELALLANSTGAKIIIKNPRFLPSQMVEIARAGGNSVIFEL